MTYFTVPPVLNPPPGRLSDSVRLHHAVVGVGLGLTQRKYPAGKNVF
jgi:hypothetical protein